MVVRSPSCSLGLPQGRLTARCRRRRAVEARTVDEVPLYYRLIEFHAYRNSVIFLGVGGFRIVRSDVNFNDDPLLLGVNSLLEHFAGDTRGATEPRNLDLEIGALCSNVDEQLPGCRVTFATRPAVTADQDDDAEGDQRHSTRKISAASGMLRRKGWFVSHVSVLEVYPSFDEPAPTEELPA